MNKTKEEILIWLKNQTRIYGLTQLERLTTRNIAAQLNLSRTLASQYLNELCKEKRVRQNQLLSGLTIWRGRSWKQNIR